ncbi:hypothetical protein [Halorussus ruber]|uniref:hypothetical protein n=1 Tax=Halorussus ruber TaxID=1126238 RepID=UPI001091FC37|nr:hypothetical protein [Halorussus ruber]
MSGFLHRVLSAFVRLFGVVVAVFGAFVATTGSSETGILIVLFGVAFALRPHFVGKAADWTRMLID